jgi:polyhydroxybutyrate depolymerase
MKNIILPLLVFLIGCNPPDETSAHEKGLLKDQKITVSGTERSYHLFVPDQPAGAPVVLLFHGNGGSHDDLLGLTNIQAPYKIWLDIAKRENLIIVAPNGSKGSNNSNGWNDCRDDAPTNPPSDDVALVKALLQAVSDAYQSDPKRVFAVGTSNGGHFAIRLATEIPNQITAFAAIVAANTANSKCANSAGKVSALFMNGTEDPIMPYNGGAMAANRGEVVSTDSTVRYWVSRNQAVTTPEVTVLEDSDNTDNSTAVRYLYQCGDGTEVVLYEIINGGHTEPSKSERYSSLFLLAVGKQNGDLEMADEIWAFFKNKTK